LTGSDAACFRCAVLKTTFTSIGVVCGLCAMARADEPTLPTSPTSPAPQPAPAPPAAEPPLPETVVTATTPLHGSGLPREEVPANVQTVTAAQLAAQHSLDLSSYLGAAVGSVHVNDVQNNPLQPDLQYRGFLASPLLGAPQGLSMYLDGVRLNEPFGDTINWDLIPTNAIRSVNVIPGSNPIFGLNTLGGALSIETKDGFSDSGVEGSLLYGSFGRKLARASGGAHGERFAVFAAAQLLDEDGWRDHSPTSGQQAFLSASYRNQGSWADLSLLAGNSSLTGNGPAPEQLLATGRNQIFTYPDTTRNQMFMAVLRGERPLSAHVALSGAAYARTNRTRSVNGDQREWSACTMTAGVLCSTDDSGAEIPVLDANGNPVPFSDTYDAALNRTDTRQTSVGLSAQLAAHAPLRAHENHFFLGATVDQSRIRFRAQSTVGHLEADRGTTDLGFLDPASPIAVDSVVDDFGVYASDTLALRPQLFLTLSARLNLSSLSLRDQLGDALNGDHSFHRLNPAAGLSYQPRPWLGGYFGYSESSRAPTAMELTCASPTDPCRLPNAFLTDPPLAQVVARTFEAGLRGGVRRGGTSLRYDVTAFRTTNSDDILFISSGAVANQGYFANVGETRRQGLETSLSGRRRLGARAGDLDWALYYTLTDATFQTSFVAPSATHPDAVNGSIAVPAGAHIPSIPAHTGKAVIGWTSSFGLFAGLNLLATSSQYLRGDEANLLAPVPGFVVVGARLGYQIAPPIAIVLLANNLFDARYSTFGVLGDAADVLGAAYDSRRFLGPGAPRAAWLEVDLRY
jgi:outer membrane receptor protein involved in Fe transport